MGIVAGIDASRNRSGGAKAHLVGILQDGKPLDYGISEVHVWSYKDLLDALPDYSWLIKHSPPELEKSLLQQVWWQYHSLPIEAKKNSCDILLNTDAGTVCRFRPAVVISQDMLSYEKGEMNRFGFTLARLRLILLGYLQSRSIKYADGVIFLTQYAANVIQMFTGKLLDCKVIPHGIGVAFKQKTSSGAWAETPDREVRCLYVSNVLLYKHQWHVVKALKLLRDRGYNISVVLAGGGEKNRAQTTLDEAILELDPELKFTKQIDFVRHDKVPSLLADADIFIFASSCENMPITLLEAMAGGLPIACSNRGPMPEVLEDGGMYFDPENPYSIAEAIEKIVNDRKLRITIAERAKNLSEQYSWVRCSSETWDYLVTTYKKTLV